MRHLWLHAACALLLAWTGLHAQTMPAAVDTSAGRPIETTLRSDAGLVHIADIPHGSVLSFDFKGVRITEFPRRVEMYLTVEDAEGRFVSGLAQPYAPDGAYRRHFTPLVETVIGKSVQREITDYVVTEVHEDEADPLAVALVLDFSGSMEGSSVYLQEAVRQLLRLMAQYHRDDVAIIKYDHRVATSEPLTAQLQDVLKRFVDDFPEWGGNTAIYAGAAAGLRTLEKSGKEKVLLLFTDGIENASLPLTSSDVMKEARMRGIRIYTVGFGTTLSDIDQPLLTDMAVRTGGRFYFAPRGEERTIINEIFRDIFLSLKVYYRLVYTPIQTDLTLPRDVWLTFVHPHNPDVQMTGTATYYPPGTDHTMQEEHRYYTMARFDVGSADIPNEYHARLDSIAAHLVAERQHRMEVVGHTDSRGSARLNLALGMKRAKAVAEWLMERGVRASQIVVASHGESQLMRNPDSDVRDARENRRVIGRFLR